MDREYRKTKKLEVIWEIWLVTMTTDRRIGWKLFGTERLN